MTLLAARSSRTFQDLKSELQMSDGNLVTDFAHAASDWIRRLHEGNTRSSTNQLCADTKRSDRFWKGYLRILEQIVKSGKKCYRRFVAQSLQSAREANGSNSRCFSAPGSIWVSIANSINGERRSILCWEKCGDDPSARAGFYRNASRSRRTTSRRSADSVARSSRFRRATCDRDLLPKLSGKMARHSERSGIKRRRARLRGGSNHALVIGAAEFKNRSARETSRAFRSGRRLPKWASI